MGGRMVMWGWWSGCGQVWCRARLTADLCLCRVPDVPVGDTELAAHNRLYAADAGWRPLIL